MSHVSAVKRDIARWHSAGLIDRNTAAVLSREIEDHVGRAVSFGSILSLLAAVLVSAALLIFIAANWEAFPRLLRVAGLFAIIFGAYFGGAVLKLRGGDGYAEALWLVGAAAFGGSIALIAQMYHLSGDETQAVLVWCAGTAVAALALRSGTLNVAAMLIAGTWMVVRLGYDFSADASSWTYPALVIALWLLSAWTRSRPTWRLAILSLIFYAALQFVSLENLWIAYGLACWSAAAVVAAIFFPHWTSRLLGIGTDLAALGMIGFLLASALVQIYYADAGVAILPAAVTLAATVGALLLAGHELRGLRWLAYLGFSVQLAWLYLTLLGSMLGTAGFFLTAGILLAALAIVITRLEQRLGQKPGSVAA